VNCGSFYLFDGPAQFLRQFPKVTCVTNIVRARAWKVNFHVHFYFAGTLGQHEDAVCQKGTR
jgi:hypothetical protein